MQKPKESDGEFCKNFKVSIRHEISKRFGSSEEQNQYLLLSTYLDPRFKDFLFNNALKGKIYHFLLEIFTKYLEMEEKKTEKKSPSPSSQGQQFNEQKLNSIFGERLSLNPPQKISHALQGEQEIKGFLSEEKILINQNPFEWWRKTE